VDSDVPIVNDTRIKAVSIAELDATDEQFDALFQLLFPRALWG